MRVELGKSVLNEYSEKIWGIRTDKWTDGKIEGLTETDFTCIFACHLT